MPAVDRSFLKDLKSMDKRLGIKFNGNNFIVTYERPCGDPANIHCVRDADGGFRQPDQRDLSFIRSGDMENDRLKDKLNRMAAASEAIRERERAKVKDEIRAMTKDGKIQLRNAFSRATNDGKFNSAFRRV